jgi:25S rRNA (uracil2634-N3)-methyltransferase
MILCFYLHSCFVYSFTGALTRKYGTAEANVTELKRLGATVLHGVDAKTMKLHSCLNMRRFDRIVFNFPHAGFKGKEDQLHVIKYVY